MAKKREVTKHNTGLSISRTGGKFTASWKIKCAKMKTQKWRWRTHNGSRWSGWTTQKIGDKTTEKSLTLANTGTFTKVQVQTQALRRDTDNINYTASEWKDSSAVYTITAPSAPTLEVEYNSANSTTFTWSAGDSGTGWYRCCYYRTFNGYSWSAWAVAGTTSYTYTDNMSGRTRAFAIYAVGPAGSSGTVTQNHYIGPAPSATWSGNKVSCAEKSSYYQMTYSISLSASTLTVDSIIPQYYIGKPTANMECPSDASWTNGTTYTYNNGTTSYALSITTSEVIGADECLWARVRTTHDSIDSFSPAHRVLTGSLVAPIAEVSMGTISASGFSVTINITDKGTDVDGTYSQVYLEKGSATGENHYILIGTIPDGTATRTITSNIDLTNEEAFGIHIRNVTADGSSMKSGYYNYATTMPSEPLLTSVDPTTVSGKVYLTWTNRWRAASGVIIAWTDDPDNWMSNDDPETYELSEIVSNWFITGLETGKVWYFRVRSVRTIDDSTTLSPWSNEVSIDLSAAPVTPALYLSSDVIREDGMVTAYWSYASTDGTAQISANVVQATRTNNTWTYSEPVGTATSAQHIDIYAKDHGWTNGTTVYLALQTGSGSGGISDYSIPIPLVIAAEPTVSITNTSLANTETVTEYFVGDGSTRTFTCTNTLSAAPTVTVNGTTRSATYSGDVVTVSSAPANGSEVAITYTTAASKILTTLPLSVTVAATNAATLSLAIERANDYPLMRPDDTTTDGAKGETIYINTIAANSTNTVSIDTEQLIGRLDDGALYNIVASVADEYGQTADAEPIPFKVHWDHQAEAPTATFITDSDRYIARITPIAPESYQTGDTCDIYRLSSDQPELIISGGTFGTEYVDPYPAFGQNSGYKVVTVTKYGDYITDDNTFAEYDTLENEEASYNQIDPQMMVIDFGGEQVELPYNITLANSWQKDFKRTSYLGGHVTGDFNRAVTRDLSASTVLARNLDEETAVIMRGLASYAGICHVRTPEGSSFTADVQVSEDRAFDSGVISYDLKIQKIDTEGFDGMTYAEWSELNDLE